MSELKRNTDFATGGSAMQQAVEGWALPGDTSFDPYNRVGHHAKVLKAGAPALVPLTGTSNTPPDRSADPA